MSIDLEMIRSLRPGANHYRAYVGPPAQYDFMGATQFRLLTTLGLREDHYVLDIGCGSLRAGRLLIPYLLPERYCGIEPNTWLVDDAIASEIGHDLVRLKRPRFDANADFDYTVFGHVFDYVLAQSVFSHTGLDLAARGIANLAAVMHDETVALVTFVLAETAPPDPVERGWVYPAVVSYHPATVERLVSGSGLFAARLPWFHPRQTWFLISKHKTLLPSESELQCLTGAVLRDERFQR